jgi:hypothetical protein
MSQGPAIGAGATGAKQDTGNTSIAAVSTFSTTLQYDLLSAILIELKIMNTLLQTGLNVQDSLDVMRTDPYFAP